MAKGQCDEFGSWRFVSGETDCEPTAEGFKVPHQKFRIASAPAQAHLIKSDIEEASNLL
jgi:hypothetical protein